jgi:glycosyl hydrolase family 26
MRSPRRGRRRKGSRRRAMRRVNPRFALVAVTAVAGLVTAVAAIASLRHADAAGQAGPRSQAGTGLAAGSAASDPGKAGTAGTTDGHGNRWAADPLVPASGAYLGAYVQPASYTSPGQIDAVRAFEQQLGHPLGLVHVYHPWDSPFPSAADRQFARSHKMLLLTWGGTPDTRTIIAGGYDALIRQRAEAVKRLHRPILMEFRHEMDRANLQWAMHSPAKYTAAWDHIRAIFTAAGATNARWVWCPTAYGFAIGRAQAFYPGNKEVDWVCADAYSPSPSVPLSVTAGTFLDWAARHPKPVIIGEFGVGGNPAGWPAWLAAAGRLASHHPQIKAMSYFSGDGTDSNGRRYAYFMGTHARAVRAFARLLAERQFGPRLPRGPTR